MSSLRKIFWVIFLFFFGAASSVFADNNLLTNSDFDDWEGSGPVNWQKSATSNFSIENASGSALLKLTTSNYRYLYQTASVSGSTPYRFSGLVRILSGSASAFLRLAWYCQTCTNQLSTDDSNTIETPLSDYSEVFLETNSPPTAAFARARIMVVPQTGSNDNQVAVDKMYLGLAGTSLAASSQAISTGPAVQWSVGTQYEVGEIFEVNVNLSKFDANTEYYLKIRGGTEESSLNKLQTKNGSSFYGDTESWNKFPVIKTDQNGTWVGQVSGRLDEDRPNGEYRVRLRLRKKDTDSSYDSDIKSVKFAPSVKVELPASLELIDSQEAIESTESARETAEEILGTSSAVFLEDLIASSAPTFFKKDSQVHQPNVADGLALIAVGLLSTSLATIPFFRKIRLWRYNKPTL